MSDSLDELYSKIGIVWNVDTIILMSKTIVDLAEVGMGIQIDINERKITNIDTYPIFNCSIDSSTLTKLKSNIVGRITTEHSTIRSEGEEGKLLIVIENRVSIRL
jgi:hypothetical protein